MEKLAEILKNKLDKMTQEELEEKWKQYEHYNECGPTVEECIGPLNENEVYRHDEWPIPVTRYLQPAAMPSLGFLLKSLRKEQAELHIEKLTNLLNPSVSNARK